MRVLLDTNIIIHREANRIIRPEIGNLFNWLDRLKYTKCVHPSSIDEIRSYQDPVTVHAFEKKIDSYHILKTLAHDTPEILAISSKYDSNDNDRIDTSLLKEVFSERVDMLITEDRKMHRKARELGIDHKVFTIETFLEKVVSENPDLVDYKVLSVRKEHFGNLNLDDSFFDSFKGDYPGFDRWFNKKADEIAYVCQEDDAILAFLYIKTEGIDESYNDIEPPLPPKNRLKIGTFKVIANGFKLGERFLKIVFDNAFIRKVNEIYVTIFDKTEDQKRLIALLEEWGFVFHGIKQSKGGNEQVYVRDLTPHANMLHPMKTYPYASKSARKFIVPIYPEYHTELFPDSILNNESPLDFVESKPNRNAINKVYISRSIERDLRSGDIIVFYRTKTANQSAYYSSVTTTLGIVQRVVDAIPNLDTFIKLCRKRSVFSDEELEKHWNYRRDNRPFVVDFLYVFSFPKRCNLKQLKENHIIQEAPRGFERLSDRSFQQLMEISNVNQRFIVD